jgi:hypothetical protein
LGALIEARKCEVREAAQLAEQAELVIDAAGGRPVAVVKAGVSVHECEPCPAVNRPKKSELLKPRDGLLESVAQRRGGVEAMVVMQLDLAVAVAYGFDQRRDRLGGMPLAGIKPCVLQATTSSF